MQNNKYNNETEFIFSGEFFGFTHIPNYIFNCKELSYRAVGIYCSILQFQNSPTHAITVKGLANAHKEGRDAVGVAINELIKHGFLERIEKREKGKIKGIIYKVHMKPIENTCVEPITEKPVTEKPITEKPQHKNKLIKKENLLKQKSLVVVVTSKEVHQSMVNYSSKELSEATKTKLNEYTSKLGDQLVLKAIEQAEELGGKTLKYVWTVLDAWIKKGITTLEDVEADNAKHETAKEKKREAKKVAIAGKSNTPVNKTFTQMITHDWDLQEIEDAAVAHAERKIEEYQCYKNKHNYNSSHNWDYDELERAAIAHAESLIRPAVEESEDDALFDDYSLDISDRGVL